MKLSKREQQYVLWAYLVEAMCANPKEARADGAFVQLCLDARIAYPETFERVIADLAPQFRNKYMGGGK
jgi:hypothetical protein